jgi:electron transfer flavoprotein-quinone oxidoreductase
VTNPTPNPGGPRITRAAAARHGVKLRELAADALRGMRIFG